MCKDYRILKSNGLYSSNNGNGSPLGGTTWSVPKDDDWTEIL